MNKKGQVFERPAQEGYVASDGFFYHVFGGVGYSFLQDFGVCLSCLKGGGKEE
jgi:hypothetical protein